MHDLIFNHETEQDAVFICTKCSSYIGFNKSEQSDPHATLVDGVWSHPENPEQWMAPCTQ